MSDASDLYPVSCAFCKIADAYPPQSTSSFSFSSTSTPVPTRKGSSSSSASDSETLKSSIPAQVDADACSPACHLVLNSPTVMAFLDIMPMTAGHLLVTTRSHHVKIEDLPSEEARDLGPRAAQVVPHVHVHIIPRPDSVPQIQHRSWTMFGRGAREDLDDDEAAKLGAEIRAQARAEIDRRFEKGSKI